MKKSEKQEESEDTSIITWKFSSEGSKVTRTTKRRGSSEDEEEEEEEDFSIGTPVYLNVAGQPEPAIIISISNPKAEAEEKGEQEIRKKSKNKSKGKRKRKEEDEEEEEKVKKEKEKEENSNTNDSPFTIEIRWFVWPQSALNEYEQIAMAQAIRDNEIYYTHRQPRTASTSSRRQNQLQGIEEEVNMQYIIHSFTLHSSPKDCQSAMKALDDPKEAYFEFEEEELPSHLFCTYAMDPSSKLMWNCDWDTISRNGMSKGDWTAMYLPPKEKEDSHTIPHPISTPGKDPRIFALTVRSSTYDTVQSPSTKPPRSETQGGKTRSQSKPKGKPPKVKREGPRFNLNRDAEDESADEKEESDDSDEDSSDEDSEEESESESGSDSEILGRGFGYMLQTPQKRKLIGYSVSTPSKRRAGPSSSTSTPRSTTSTLFTPRSTSRKQMLDQYTTIPSLPARPPKLSSFSTEELSALSPVERAKRLLHVGATPDHLVCREEQYSEIFNQVQGSVNEGSGSCVYVSGVPGTGKTATVRAVVRDLAESAEIGEMDPFTFVEINGMKLPDANQAYTVLWGAISGEQRVNPKSALANLNSHFSKRGSKGAPMGAGRDITVVLMDELDQLVTGRQDVLYNLFNWPNTHGSKLIIIAVANTFDLPEKLLPKVHSRLGMHRIKFFPYNSDQLVKIVHSRLGFKSEEEVESMVEKEKSEMEEVDKATTAGCAELFRKEAIQFAAMKVAAVSGDARRMLDSCRRALELAEEKSISEKKKTEKVQHSHVLEVFRNIVKSGKVAHIRALPFQAKILLGSILNVFIRQGKSEIDISDAFLLHVGECKNHNFTRSSFTNKATKIKEVNKFSNEELMRLLARLSSLGLIVTVGTGAGASRAGGLGRVMLGCEEADIKLGIGGGESKDDSDPRLRGLTLGSDRS